MRRIVDGLIREGRITRSLADYAYSQGFSDAEIIEQREKVRQSQAQLEVTGNRHLYRRQEPLANPTEPTPERKRKANGYLHSHTVGKGVYTPLKGYKLRSVMDIHADKFKDDHKTVFAAYVGDNEISQSIRVADLNSSGGSSGSRLGGLGNCPQHKRDRHHRAEWANQRLTRLDRQTLDILVTHCITKRDGAPFSAEEYGALMYPMLADKSFHRGAGVMAFMHLVDRLAELYFHPECPRVRRIDENERYLESAG